MAAPRNHMIWAKYVVFLAFIALPCIKLVIAAPPPIDKVTENKYNDICFLMSCDVTEMSNSSIVFKQCKNYNLTVSGHCCAGVLNDTDEQIIGVDLSNCMLTNTSGLNPMKELKWIVLEENPHLNHTDFEGLSDIEYLSLPPSFTCPGGQDAWRSVNYTDDVTICEYELNTCVTQNVSCPKDESECHPDGPGESLCLCADGYHGYKCMRSSYFPYIVFVLTICGVTLVVSIFLGATQRSRVKKKKDR